MKSIFGLSIVLILMVSCKKETNDNGHNYECHQSYISPEISNFKFKKGTYWVYVDSVSLITDTMRVDSILFDGMGDYPQCYGAYLESYVFQVSTGSPKNSYAMYSNQLMFNPQYSTSNMGGGTEIYLTTSPKRDSLFIYDRYYRSVVSYTHASEHSENNHKTVFYTNTTFGFLKKEVYNSSNQLISQKLLTDKHIVR